MNKLTITFILLIVVYLLGLIQMFLYGDFLGLTITTNNAFNYLILTPFGYGVVEILIGLRADDFKETRIGRFLNIFTSPLKEVVGISLFIVTPLLLYFIILKIS